MIDINLLGKKPNKAPKPKLNMDYNPKTVTIFGLLIVIVGIYYIFQDELLGLFIAKPVTYQPISVPETTVQTPPETTITQPVQDPVVEEPEVTWDYNLSMNHIETFIALNSIIPEKVDYNVISVSGDRIIAEITTNLLSNSSDFKNNLRESLPNYDFNFKENGSRLDIWGTIKANAGLSDMNLSSDFTSPAVVLQSISDLSTQYKIRIQARDLSAELSRNNLTVIPGWIKFTGLEDKLLEFLSEIHSKGYSINVTRISGSSLNRSAGQNSRVNLSFQYELIY